MDFSSEELLSSLILSTETFKFLECLEIGHLLNRFSAGLLSPFVETDVFDVKSEEDVRVSSLSSGTHEGETDFLMGLDEMSISEASSVWPLPLNEEILKGF